MNLALADSRSVISNFTYTALPATFPAFAVNASLWFAGLKV